MIFRIEKQRVKISTINHTKKKKKKEETKKNKIKQKTTILLKTKIAITSTTQKNQQNWKFYSKYQDKTIKSKRIIDISNKLKHTSLHSKKPSNHKQTASCSQ